MDGGAILTGLEVEGLFGELDYQIRFDKSSNLSLLYGENGSGKTTLLRLIYAALSPDPAGGLRSYILSVPFKRLAIRTGVGARVELTRKEAAAGPYDFVASNMDGTSDCHVEEGEVTRQDLASVLDRLKQFDFDIHFLSDNRLLMSSADFFNRVVEVSPPTRRRESDERPNLLRAARGEGDRTWLNIESTVFHVHNWFRQQAFEQASVGQRSTNQIYLDLAKSLVSAWRSSVDPTPQEYEGLLSELDKLRDKAAPLLQLRTIPVVSFDEFKSLLATAPEDRRADLVSVLRPFIESTHAQIEALSSITNVMTLLIRELNSFLKRKRASFDVYSGLQVHSAKGKLPFTALSSGEKQLFLLLCSGFLSRQSRCVFLIDEPELSLNVYWQRSLPRTLQRIVSGARTQYVLATHSLEILTEFGNHIASLESADAAP